MRGDGHDIRVSDLVCFTVLNMIMDVRARTEAEAAWYVGHSDVFTIPCSQYHLLISSVNPSINIDESGGGEGVSRLLNWFVKILIVLANVYERVCLLHRCTYFHQKTNKDQQQWFGASHCSSCRSPPSSFIRQEP